MGGAPISVTLYENGIEISPSSVPFVRDEALEREMRRAFDAGESVEASLWGGPLSPLLDVVEVAIDCIWAYDRRDERHDQPAQPMPSSGGAKKKKKKR